jgi:hypothetical protein
MLIINIELDLSFPHIQDQILTHQQITARQPFLPELSKNCLAILPDITIATSTTEQRPGIPHGMIHQTHHLANQQERTTLLHTAQ